MSDDIVAFIRARLDEGESWVSSLPTEAELYELLTNGQLTLNQFRALNHFANPPSVARALRLKRKLFEFEEGYHKPKRDVVKWADPPDLMENVYGDICEGCSDALMEYQNAGGCAYDAEEHEIDCNVPWPCKAVLFTASEWSDDPDFREEWATPEGD
ncbi:MAG: hypothetical protein ACREQ5_00640 [Candidatus Dormibacteria bacterium]